ncbi:MAG: filamentous hemagglutinin N-terminal domain-containing protein [Cyanobacteriota bacterium]|nr:filamentous hemagglutinin N-terminal domain-containing protein [Cyanobacteriota bacterium]
MNLKSLDSPKLKLSTPFEIAAIFFSSISMIFPQHLNAQILPDETLPNNSIVEIEGTLQRITGGTETGSNLFHSFEQFNLDTGGVAYFDNALTIDNIITRVTGGQLSNIDGLIQANGSANLFLLNPSGIVFGPNAALNIGGSFVTSTADSLLFEDGSFFSATEPQNSILTVSVPVGLQLGTNPGGITNRSNVALPDGTTVGLAVQPTQTIRVVGGEIAVEGGYITAVDGAIDLISGNDRTVIFDDPFANTNPLTGTIQLSENASVSTSGLGGGRIQMRGGEIFLDGNSRVTGDTFGSFNGGGIEVEANTLRLQDGSVMSASTYSEGNSGGLSVRTDLLEIFGTRPDDLLTQLVAETINPLELRDGLFSISAGAGKSGDLSIETRELNAINQVGIMTTTFVAGDGGNLNLQVAEEARFDRSVILAGTAGAGNSGDVTLSAGDLRSFDNTFIGAVTGVPSTGNGGDVTISAETIELRGVPGGQLSPGGFFSTSLGAGASGDLTVNAREIIVADGMQISASAAGEGRGGDLTITAESIDLDGASEDGRFISGLYTSSSLLTLAGQKGTAPAGDLTVNVDRLSVRDGAQISAATGGDGDAGSLQVNATESVEVIGFATGIDASVESVSFGIIGDGIVPSAIESNTRAAGNAGDLTIQTERLSVSNQAEIGVRGLGSGAAGNLNIIANEIQLDERGALSAVTASGAGGDIRLDAAEIQLRNNSRISTDAGNTDGGNISIETDTLVALENSDITANAQQGFGGQVNIVADGVFGTQFRDQQTPESDITATSELGAAFSGVVTVQTPDVDPGAGLIQLPDSPIDPTEQVVSGCGAYADSQFVVTGRGGLPEDPTATLSSQTVWRDWREFSGETQTRHQIEFPVSQSSPLVEATGWTTNENGQVELIASVPQTDGGDWSARSHCGERSSL